MLNSGKNFVLCATKILNILTIVLSEKKILNETKNNNPPFKLNGRSLRTLRDIDEIRNANNPILDPRPC